MRVLWSAGETPLRSLIEQLAEERRTPAYSTVTTILTRLRERGLVERSRRGREAVYRATLSEAQLVEASSSRAVDALIARYGAAALRHFAMRLGDADPGLREQLISLAASRPAAKKVGDR